MKKKILAIDDSKAIRFLLQTVLGKDYQVVTAPDGCTAMYWLSKKNIPDLIIADPQLTDMKDWEMIEELSTSVLYKNIPIMVISSLDKNITQIKCEEYGIAEYFLKPFNPVYLLESVSNITGKTCDNHLINPTMSISSPHKAPQKTYRHYSVVPVVAPAIDATENKKLDFFYIGKGSGVIDTLIKTFESGYAAENAEQARVMLKRLTTYTTKSPDVIIAEGTLGHNTLLLFYQFISSNKHLSNVPFFVEGSNLTLSDLEKFSAEPFADDVISLKDLGNEKLVSKIKFWKKIRQRISAVQEPMREEASQVKNSPADFSKRTFDIVISALLLIILSPVFLLIMLALKIESKGPVFYISKRAGRGYNIFNFYKFRTMELEANSRISDFSHLNVYNPLKSDGPLFIKIDNDPRITRLGAFLRKRSLDELPQLWNVFKGDMSLVGNRPLPLYEAATLTTDEWAKRFMAPAGMTGLWQIKKKSKYKMTAEERINLDINYADKSNFLFDLWIMANTPYAVIQRTNA